MFSGRRSHAGNIIKNFSNNQKADLGSDGFFIPRYRDTYAKALFDIDNSNKLVLNFYHGHDDFTDTDSYLDQFQDTIFRFQYRDQYKWGNMATGLRWLHTFSPRIFSKINVYYSRYHYRSINAFQLQSDLSGLVRNIDTDLTEFRSKVSEKGLKMDLDVMQGKNHVLQAGLGLIFNTYTPGIIAYDGMETGINTSLQQTELRSLPEELFDDLYYRSWQSYLYLHDHWTFSDRWSLRYGFHSSYFRNGATSYLTWQPRVNLRWQRDKMTFDFSISQIDQPLHLLSVNGTGLPNELWVPATESFAPQNATHFDISWHLVGTTSLSLGCIGILQEDA